MEVSLLPCCEGGQGGTSLNRVGSRSGKTSWIWSPLCVGWRDRVHLVTELKKGVQQPWWWVRVFPSVEEVPKCTLETEGKIPPSLVSALTRGSAGLCYREADTLLQCLTPPQHQALVLLRSLLLFGGSACSDDF